MEALPLVEADSLGAHWGSDPPLGGITISPSGHRVPFLRTAARFMGGMDGCVLIRSSNPAVLVPDLPTAVRGGGNGDGCVLIRSALSIGWPIAVGIN